MEGTERMEGTGEGNHTNICGSIDNTQSDSLSSSTQGSSDEGEENQETTVSVQDKLKSSHRVTRLYRRASHSLDASSETSGSDLEALYGLTNNDVEQCFTQSNKLVCIMHLGTKFKRINKKWEEVLGWSVDELLRIPYYQLIHPHDIVKTKEYEKNFIPTGFVNRYICRDGSYRWLSWTGISNLDKADGNHIPFSIVVDVTSQEIRQKQQEEDAKAGEIQYQLLQEKADLQRLVMQAVVDLQVHVKVDQDNIQTILHQIISIFVRITRSTYGFTGLVIKERETRVIPYKTWVRSIGEDEMSSSEANSNSNNNNQIKQKALFSAEHIAQETSGSVYFDKLLTRILSKPDQVLLEVNTQLSEQLVFVESVLGLPITINNQPIGVIVLVNYDESCAKYFPGSFEPIMLTAASMLQDMQGIYFKKEASSQRLSREVADAQSQAKSTFLAHMSHELRTPLGGLLGSLDLINDEYLSESDKNYLAIARQSGASLLNIINDILDLSKIEEGKLQLEQTNININKLVQEVTTLLTFNAKKKNLELTCIVSPDIPTLLKGDSTRIRQIFMNLVGNAIKFTESGKVTLEVKYAMQQKAGYKISALVSDTGIGMDAEAQKRLFVPFNQADATITRRFGGTGLGLYITKGLCNLMGGDISVSSVVGKGSTFTFTFLLLSPAATDLSIKESSAEADSLPYPIKTIIAEDNKVNQTLLKEVLRKGGVGLCSIAENGLEVLELLKKDAYELILMDGSMPEMDGIETTRQIRGVLKNDDIIIIGVTAHAMKEDKDKFIQAGMNGYVTKPIKKNILYAEISRCIEQSKNNKQKAM